MNPAALHIEARPRPAVTSTQRDLVLPATREEAAAPFGCVPMRADLGGESCTRRHLRAPTKPGRGMGWGAAIHGPCDGCPMGAARAKWLEVG